MLFLKGYFLQREAGTFREWGPMYNKNIRREPYGPVNPVELSSKLLKKR
jgi:hypothetical protein